jgi:hypothetical protein
MGCCQSSYLDIKEHYPVWDLLNYPAMSVPPPIDTPSSTDILIPTPKFKMKKILKFSTAHLQDILTTDCSAPEPSMTMVI